MEPARNQQQTWITTTALLESLRDPAEAGSWSLIVARWRPVVEGYFRKRGLDADSADEIAQRTFAEFARAFTQGKYQRQKGRLRDWLFGIARIQFAAWKRDQPPALVPLEEPGAADDEVWHQQWRSRLLQLCLDRVALEVELATMEAFNLYCLRGVPPPVVAEQLGISENAVYLAKRRVLRRTRELLLQMDTDEDLRTE